MIEYERYMEEYMIRPLIDIVNKYLGDTQLNILGYMDKGVDFKELKGEFELMCEYMRKNPGKMRGVEYEEYIEEMVKNREIEKINGLVYRLTREGRENILLMFGRRVKDKKEVFMRLVRDGRFEGVSSESIYEAGILIDREDGHMLKTLELIYTKGYELKEELWGIIIKYINPDKRWDKVLINILDWVLSKGCVKAKCGYTEAIRNSNLVAMEWLYKNGFPFDSDIASTVTDRDTTYRDEWGREIIPKMMEILEWCLERGLIKEEIRDKIYENAIIHRNREMVKYLYDIGVPYRRAQNIVRQAIKSEFTVELREIFGNDKEIVELIEEEWRPIRREIMEEDGYEDIDDIPIESIMEWYRRH